MSEPTTTKTSGLAIAGLVLGVLAAATSFLPIINNLSAILAVIGGLLAIAALVGAIRGKNSSKGLAIAGVVLAVVSFVIVMVTQSMYVAAIDSALDEATSGSKPVAATSSKDGDDQSNDATAAQETAQAAEQDYSNLAVGTTVDLDDGVSVTVNEVETGLANYDDSLITRVKVTYVNNGSGNVSFNSYDWKGEDANGAQRSIAYYSDGTETLNSGTLSPGGSVTGNLYFDDGIVRVLYYSNMFNDSPSAGWTI